MRRVDAEWEPDPEVVAEKAMVFVERVREDDPAMVFAEVQALCQWHPAKAAQVLITLAAWFNPDESTESLVRRVQSISAARVGIGRAS